MDKQQIAEILDKHIVSFFIFLPKLIIGLLVLVVFIILGKIIRKMVAGLVKSDKVDDLLESFLARTAEWLIIIIGIAIMLNIVGLSGVAQGIVTSAGIITVVIGFAFRNAGENLISGVMLAFSRPFDIGDKINVGGLEGVVKEINLKNVHIFSVEGKDIFIPNTQVFTSAVTVVRKTKGEK